MGRKCRKQLQGQTVYQGRSWCLGWTSDLIWFSKVDFISSFLANRGKKFGPGKACHILIGVYFSPSLASKHKRQKGREGGNMLH